MVLHRRCTTRRNCAPVMGRRYVVSPELGSQTIKAAKWASLHRTSKLGTQLVVHLGASTAALVMVYFRSMPVL
jgi:hypothetical protein